MYQEQWISTSVPYLSTVIPVLITEMDQGHQLLSFSRCNRPRMRGHSSQGLQSHRNMATLSWEVLTDVKIQGLSNQVSIANLKPALTSTPTILKSRSLQGTCSQSNSGNRNVTTQVLLECLTSCEPSASTVIRAVLDRSMRRSCGRPCCAADPPRPRRASAPRRGLRVALEYP